MIHFSFSTVTQIFQEMHRLGVPGDLPTSVVSTYQSKYIRLGWSPPWARVLSTSVVSLAVLDNLLVTNISSSETIKFVSKVRM